MLNKVEQNIVLYYADYLSLKQISIPVTDNCKYYFIHGVPMNSAYIVGLLPFYDAENPYYQQSYMEYITLKKHLDEDAINSFIENICYLRAFGCVDAEDMLNCIHQFSTKGDRKAAFNRYEKWRDGQGYVHTILNDSGDEIEEQCTRFIAHYEHIKNPQKRIRYIEKVSIFPGIQESPVDSNGTREENS